MRQLGGNCIDEIATANVMAVLISHWHTKQGTMRHVRESIGAHKARARMLDKAGEGALSCSSTRRGNGSPFATCNTFSLDACSINPGPDLKRQEVCSCLCMNTDEFGD